MLLTNTMRVRLDMKLDDVLNNPLKIHKHPDRAGFRKFLKIIKRNNFNPSDLWQASMKSKAIKAGLIDEELNILKEV
jgi:hypothetical protein